jgi:hypothetical protein
MQSLLASKTPNQPGATFCKGVKNRGSCWVAPSYILATAGCRSCQPASEGLHHEFGRHPIGGWLSKLALSVPLKHTLAALDQVPNCRPVVLNPQVPQRIFDQAMLGGFIEIAFDGIAKGK